jgi:glutathione synthase
MFQQSYLVPQPAISHNFFTSQTFASPTSSVLRLGRTLTLSLAFGIAFSSAWSPSSTAASPMTTTTTTTLEASLPLELLAETANSFASAHGLQIEKRRDDGSSIFECAPISLLPNAYPRAAFRQAQTVAPYFNTLVDRISRDSGFLTDTLGGAVAQADPFTAQLLRLYQQIYGADENHTDRTFAQRADRLGIHRSDYMLHENNAIKQVELNTIASSFGALGAQVARLHQHLVTRWDVATRPFLAQNVQAVTGQSTSSSTDTSGIEDGVPDNPTLERLPLALKIALDRFERRHRDDNDNNRMVGKTSVLFVVQEGESNTVDQRMLEFRLWQDHKVPVLRRTLTKLGQVARVDPTTGILYVDDEPISVVYFRAGYAPTDYPDGDAGVEWQARATLEQSIATKCPSLGYHLAGTKKVQQELARVQVLERFFPDDAEAVTKMREAFAGLYSLGDDASAEDLAAIRAVLDEGAAGRFVLKPQREGGGYNFYGERLAAKLRENVVRDDANPETMVLDAKLGEYILMERLFPPTQRAVLLRSGRVEGTGDSVSEFGCFGTIVCDADGTVVHNEYAGFLLRTKFANVDEGGVASGFATLSSPYLC